MVAEQKVISVESVVANGLTLKTYYFNSVSSVDQAKAHLLDCVMYNQIDRNNIIGIGFLYGRNPTPHTYVDGADIFILREPDSPNSLFKSWTFENEYPKRREDGIGNTDEVPIFKLENDLRKR
jgi:hypothetical protein